MRIILVRHGETLYNEEGRVQGIGDIELTEKGRMQARRIADALAREKLAGIYSSPLRRALDTAGAIAQPHSLEIMVDDDLKELDVGELHGLTYAEMAEGYGDFLMEWMQGPDTLRMPGGETMAELCERTWASIQRIIQKHDDGLVVAVSHSFAIQSILCRALDLPLSNFRKLRLALGGMSILEFGRRGTSLVLLNDTCHLEGLTD